MISLLVGEKGPPVQSPYHATAARPASCQQMCKVLLVNKTDAVASYPMHSCVQQLIMLANFDDASGGLELSVMKQHDPATLGRLDRASRVLRCPR